MSWLYVHTKEAPRSIQDGVLFMVTKHKKLSKDDWCPVRQNMANGSAPIAGNLCIPTASSLQD